MVNAKMVNRFTPPTNGCNIKNINSFAASRRRVVSYYALPFLHVLFSPQITQIKQINFWIIVDNFWRKEKNKLMYKGTMYNVPRNNKQQQNNNNNPINVAKATIINKKQKTLWEKSLHFSLPRSWAQACSRKRRRLSLQLTTKP